MEAGAIGQNGELAHDLVALAFQCKQENAIIRRPFMADLSALAKELDTKPAISTLAQVTSRVSGRSSVRDETAK